LAHAAYAHAVALKAKLPRRPHSLAAAVPEELSNVGSGHGGDLLSNAVYIIGIYQGKMEF
jgi:hypothetical protein